MKKIIVYFFAASAINFIVMPTGFSQIAAGFVGDVNIQTHPDVIFTEMFEQNTLTQMKTNWTDTSKVSSNISFSSSVPPGSLGTKSLKLTTINDGNVNTVTNNENTYLFKRLNTGITDSVFVRFYIKYNNNTAFHHTGLWLGGNNPANPWPGNRAGYKPAGDSSFHIGAEVRGTTMAAASNSRFGFYNYWTAMHISTQINPSTGTPYYWGNEFINSNPLANIDMSGWNCIEIMVKLNNPVTNSNGELAMWINGNKISHHGLNFPTGTWTNSNQFVEGAGTPFEGFLWRTNDVLKFNYLWLNNYVTNNGNGHVSDVLYDHIVVAKKYIGPIATSPLSLIPCPTVLNSITGANSICVGATTTLTNNTIKPSAAIGTWSSIAGRATIHPTTGLLTGTSAGTATIKYTISGGGCSGSTTKTININALPSTPNIVYANGTSNPQAGAGGGNNYCNTKTFDVVGIPSGGSWSSSNNNVMTVNNNGNISLLAVGNATLTYSYANASGCVSSRSITGNVVNCASRGLAINIHYDDNFLKIYPNPAKTYIKFVNYISDVEVYNYMGEKIIQNKSFIDQLDISGLSNGIYFLKSNQGVASFIVIK